MPQGLQCWDASGNLTVDITTRLTRVLGSQTIASGASGTITHAGFSTGTIWFLLFAGSSTATGYCPVITVNNTTHQITYAPLTYQNSDGDPVSAPAVTIVYGVY